ncbi:hypothetical protein ACS3UN_02825 [Oscillospiraceae bacterium LTW-04]|nr:hypothetical protein RBH76_07635 [Oscillospiraceae bacterium MB24-C1]
MEERHCSKCAKPITAEEKMRHNCGDEILSSPQKAPAVPVGALWLAAVLIIVGLIMVGTLVAYIVVSSFNAENWSVFTTKAERESALQIEMSVLDERRQQDEMPLIGLPAMAPDNSYIILNKEITAQREGDKILLVCAVENISDVICTGVGGNVKFFDTSGHYVGSSSASLQRDIEPGEVVELKFEIGNGHNIESYCLVEISGEPLEEQGAVVPSEETNLTDDLDEELHLTPEKIIEAKGDDPEGWVAQQEGKEFTVTGPFVEVSSSDNGQIRLVKIGQKDGACYVFVLDPALFDRLEQIEPDTEVRMRGICINFSDQPQAFVLMNGAFED